MRYISAAGAASDPDKYQIYCKCVIEFFLTDKYTVDNGILVARLQTFRYSIFKILLVIGSYKVCRISGNEFPVAQLIAL